MDVSQITSAPSRRMSADKQAGVVGGASRSGIRRVRVLPGHSAIARVVAEREWQGVL